MGGGEGESEKGGWDIRGMGFGTQGLKGFRAGVWSGVTGGGNGRRSGFFFFENE